MIAIATVLGFSFALAVQSARQVEYAAVSESSPVGDQAKMNDALSRIFGIAVKESLVSDSSPVDNTARGLSSFDDISSQKVPAFEQRRKGPNTNFLNGEPTSQEVPVFEQGRKGSNANSMHAFFDGEVTSPKVPALAHSQQLREGAPGPIGYIFHRTSGKAIHPYGGSPHPPDDTPIVTYVGAGEGRLQFRFIPVEGFGHFGFIEHVPSRAILHPYGGSSTPGDDTHLVLHRARHHGCLFTFDEELERIVHIGGKFWHPYRGQFVPPNDNRVVLHGGNNPAARFFLGDANGKKISAYSAPNLSGTWRVLRVFVSPKAPITYTETYKEGMSRTQTTTREHSWKVSISLAYSYFAASFSASAEYAGAIQHTSSSTWMSEREVSIELNVPAGETVVFWQFVYGMEQYGEGYTFKSNIIGSSNSIEIEPELV